MHIQVLRNVMTFSYESYIFIYEYIYMKYMLLYNACYSILLNVIMHVIHSYKKFEF